MGNLVSCTLVVPPNIMHKGSKSRSMTVVLPDGEVRQFRGQPRITAAELMFECPNFFLVNSRSLHVGRRFSALSADEELEVGNLYIMFPMKKMNAVITARDVASLRIMSVRGGLRSEQIPVESTIDKRGPEIVEPEPARDDAEWLSTAPIYKPRLSYSGSRKPLLETIREEPVSV